MRKVILFSCAVLLSACATNTTPDGWEDWGGFTLTGSDQLAIHHRVREGSHRLELLRRLSPPTQRRGVRWETLDVVDITLGADQFVCLRTTREGASADIAAIVNEDERHQHPIVRAWRVDAASQKLVETDAAGVSCQEEARRAR